MTSSLPPPPECAVPHVRVDITEELDLAGLSEVGLVLDRVLALYPRAVTIDLAGCRHVDAAAIALLLDVHHRMARRQAVLTVRNPHPRIRRILDAARLSDTVPIVDTPPPAGPTVRGRARVVAAPG